MKIHSYTDKELNELYKALNLPQIPGINKNDFLEYCLYFGTNLDYYPIFKSLKGKNISWRDFKYKELYELRVRDINTKKYKVTQRRIISKKENLGRE